MLNNRSTARVVPSWDTCIEVLFDAHLPIKFALTGRLSLHDITRDGFYVLRRNVCAYDIFRIFMYFILYLLASFYTFIFVLILISFPILDDIFRFKFCPLEPIYVVNCIREEPHESNLEGEQHYLYSSFFVKCNEIIVSFFRG